MKNKWRIGIFIMIATFSVLGTVSVQAATKTVAAPNVTEITNYAYLLGVHLENLESKYGKFDKTAYINPGNTDLGGKPITCYYYSSKKFPGLRFTIDDNAIKASDRDTIVDISTTSKSYAHKGWGDGLTEAQLKNNFQKAGVSYRTYFEPSEHSYFLHVGKYLVVYRYNLLNRQTLLDFYPDPIKNGWF